MYLKGLDYLKFEESSLSMSMLTKEIESVIANRVLASREAKRLLQFDWKAEFSQYSKPLQQRADEIYHLLLGSVEEVEEGYVDDETDYDLLEKISQFFRESNLGSD
jgi:hypothetical protein